jgi:hypothetical protein
MSVVVVDARAAKMQDARLVDFIVFDNEWV